MSGRLTGSIALLAATGCGGLLDPAGAGPGYASQAPSGDAPSVELALAHRASDGRVFAELPGASGDPHESANPLCAPPDCGFLTFAHRRDEPSGGPVAIVRPDGSVCSGQLAGRVDLGVVDTFRDPEPHGPRAADWRRAALVRGCRASDEPFLIAVHGGAPVPGLVSPMDAPARRAARAAPGSRRGRLATVWRFGDRQYVRVARPNDTEERWYEFDAAGRRRLEPEHVPEQSEQCCDLITGLVDVDADGTPELIVHDGYPEDALWVHLRVRGSLGWSTPLAQNTFP